MYNPRKKVLLEHFLILIPGTHLKKKSFFFSVQKEQQKFKRIFFFPLLLIKLNSKGRNEYLMPNSEGDPGCLSAVSSSGTDCAWEPCLGGTLYEEKVPCFPQALGKLKLVFSVPRFACLQSIGSATNPAQLQMFN